MGCHFSLPPNEYSIATKRSQAIDKKIKEDCENAFLEAKLLLLGTGESGKSTLMKQIRIIHGSGYSVEERLQHRPVVLSNALQSLQTVVRAMGILGIGFATEDGLRNARLLFSLAGVAACGGDHLPLELAAAMRRLSLDAGVQLCLKRRTEYQLNDSAEYLLGNLVRICQPDYLPTEADVLRARVQTRGGIAEAQFQSGSLRYRLLDVAGIGSDRKKWIHCFEGVAAVVFVAALSEYAQLPQLQQRNCTEDRGEQHALTESLLLFDSVCACRWFAASHTVLLLNKTDLFRERLTRVPLNSCFRQYTGPNEFAQAAAYIRLQFERLHGRRRGQRREIYTHFLCAIDTADSRCALESVTDAVIKSDVGLSGLF